MSDRYIYRQGHQESSTELRTTAPSGPPPLGEKAFERSHNYLEIVGEILDGHRPVLGGKNRGHKWIAAQIKDMVRQGYLPEDATAYYTEYRREPVLGYNPVPYSYAKDKEALEHALKARGLEYARVAGSGAAFQSHVTMQRQVDASSMCIAIPGALQSMQEILYIISKKLDGEKGGLLNYPLIIENEPDAESRGYWDEMLRGIKILQTEPRAYIDFGKLAEHYGIYITESREATLAVADSLSRQQALQKPTETLAIKPPIPPGSAIFVATGTDKKFRELERIFLAQGMDVKVRSIFELVDLYTPPKEESYSYEGNAAVKIKAAFDGWHGMSEEARVRRLQKLGLTKDQVFILAEDSGFHFLEPDLVNEPEFDKIRHLLKNEHAPFPGTETGPGIFSGHGIRTFMDAVRKISTRRQNFNHGVAKKCVMALAPLKQAKHGDMEMFMTAAETRGHAVYTPIPDNGALEIDNFLVPEGGNRTEAQRGDEFYVHFSPRAHALKAMAIELGIARNPGKEIQRDYEPEFVAGIITDNHHYTGRIEAERLQGMMMENGFGAVMLNAGIDRPLEAQDEIMARADGFVFHLDPARAKEDFWRNLFLFTSMIVGEQTYDKMKLWKPLYLVDPNNSYAGMRNLVWNLHETGTVAQDPGLLFKTVTSIDEAIEGLKHDRLRYRRLDTPEYVRQEEANPVIGSTNLDPDRFRVAIFCSATNENSQYLEETRALATGLIEEGFGLISGAGLYSMMGQITEAAHGMRRSHGAEHLGSNAPHIMQGEGDASEQMTQFLLARNIYERLEYMVRPVDRERPSDRERTEDIPADAFVIMPGGTGTIQELAFLVWLKERCLNAKGTNSPDYYGCKMMEGKDIVIVNSEIMTDQGKRGVYDNLLSMISEEEQVRNAELERLGIHVVSNIREAMQTCEELRAASPKEAKASRFQPKMPEHTYKNSADAPGSRYYFSPSTTSTTIGK